MTHRQLLKRLFLALFMMTLFTLVTSTAASAAGVPGIVKSFKASGKKDSIQLKWKKTKYADGYNLYQMNASGTYDKIATLPKKKKKYTIKGLVEPTRMTFRIAAFNEAGEGPLSEPKSATPKTKKPGTVKPHIKVNGNGFVTLKWKKTSNTTGYEVLQKKADGTYISLGKVKKKSVTINHLTNGQRYTFVVRAYRKSGKKIVYGNLSKEKIGKPNAPAEKSIYYKDTGVHGLWWKGKMTKTVSVAGHTFKKGKKVTVTAMNEVQAQILVNGNQQVPVPRQSVQTTALITDSKHPYTAAQAEAYVNSKGFASQTEYLIWVSLYTQHVHIFKGSQYHWVQIKHYKCASGKFDTQTPIGTANVPGKIRDWIFDHASHAFWATKLTGGQALHSILLWRGNNHVADGTLGRPASHGCVRVATANAKWVYQNVPVGTLNIRY